jgi:hypothetical protein
MWLLNTLTLELESFFSGEIPRYAILSHTWGEQEVLFDDARHGKQRLLKCGKKALDKVLGSVHIARRDGWKHIWIDTCCIDKSSSSELSEAINSMFTWYQESSICYVYLCDFDSRQSPHWKNSRWFTRGWTLQELIAPGNLDFYDTNWIKFGSRLTLTEQLIDNLGIGRKVFLWHERSYCSRDRGCEYCFETLRDVLQSYSIAARMSWAAGRATSRVEDQAYSLLGIFDINMPLLYGEGEKAFRRLQQEIVRQSADQSILAWRMSDYTRYSRRGSLFAPSPAWFQSFSSTLRDLKHGYHMALTNTGLDIELYVGPCEVHDSKALPRQNGWVAVLDCSAEEAITSTVVLLLEPISVSQSGRRQFSPSNDAVAQLSKLETNADTVSFSLSTGQTSIPFFIIPYYLVLILNYSSWAGSL